MFRFNSACHALTESKYGSAAGFVFYQSLDYVLKTINASNICLKVKQNEVIRAIVLQRRDVLAALPPGYGKSLIYQILRPVFDFFDSVGDVINQNKSIVIVVSLHSPLSSLIRDQVSKVKDSGVSVCILRADSVMEGEVSNPLDSLVNYLLVIAHPEALVDNQNVLKIFKSSFFFLQSGG